MSTKALEALAAEMREFGSADADTVTDWWDALTAIIEGMRVDDAMCERFRAAFAEDFPFLSVPKMGILTG